MKNKLVPIICGAAALAAFAMWNGQATAQFDSAELGRSGSPTPMNLKCYVTLDASSNSRAGMTQEMQQQSGFIATDTVQGTVVLVSPEWLVLKDDNSENWIPRDKILMVRAKR